MQTPKPIFFQCFQHILYKKVTNIKSITEHVPGQASCFLKLCSGFVLMRVCFVQAPV